MIFKLKLQRQGAGIQGRKRGGIALKRLTLLI